MGEIFIHPNKDLKGVEDLKGREVDCVKIWNYTLKYQEMTEYMWYQNFTQPTV